MIGRPVDGDVASVDAASIPFSAGCAAGASPGLVAVCCGAPQAAIAPKSKIAHARETLDMISIGVFMTMFLA